MCLPRKTFRNSLCCLLRCLQFLFRLRCLLCQACACRILAGLPLSAYGKFCLEVFHLFLQILFLTGIFLQGSLFLHYLQLRFFASSFLFLD